MTLVHVGTHEALPEERANIVAHYAQVLALAQLMQYEMSQISVEHLYVSEPLFLANLYPEEH